MGRIVDFLRNNLFWILMVIAVVGLACAYVFVARGMAAEVENRRNEGTVTIDSLVKLAGKKVIPNEEMKESAEKEEGDLKLLHGQLFVMFAPRSGVFDRDFEAMKLHKELEPKVYAWWEEYKTVAPVLLERAKKHLRAADDVFTVKKKPDRLKIDRKEIEKEEFVFWRIEYTIEALIYAEANTKTDISPLISKLQLIEVGERVQGKKKWVRGTSVEIKAEMAYENIGPLVAALQNSPKPLLVRSIDAVLPGKPTDVAILEEEPRATMDVTLVCEIVEFVPAIKEVSFTGKLFPKSDAEAVKGWVRKQEGELHVATVAMLKTVTAEKTRERVPGLKARAEALLGATLEDAWKTARAARTTELAKIDANAPTRLADMIDAEKAMNKGKITPALKKAVEKRHADSVAREKEVARKRYRRAELRITAKVGGFSIIYDHLRPIVAQKAYFVGLKDPMANVVIVKAPDSAKHGAGRWWIAEYRRGGKTYRPARQNKRRSVSGIISQIQESARDTVGISVDKGSADAPVLLASGDKGEIMQMLVPEPAGGWRTYTVLRAGGKPISLSDVAFRFAPVVGAVAPAIDTSAFNRSSRRVTLLSKEVKSSQQFDIPLSDGDADGVIKVVIGLRR